MSDGRTTNINIGGGNIAGLQIGDNNRQDITQNNGSQVPTVPEVFQAIGKSLADIPIEAAADADVSSEIQEQVATLQTMAELPAEQQELPEQKATWSNLIQRLVPYAPQIGKGLAVFGQAALESLALRNPVVAGVLAVCRANAA